MTDLDPVLKRQLRKLALDGLDRAPDLGAFRAFVERVDDAYRRAADDRDLLTRSLELSTQEMSQLNDRLVEQRDRMEKVVAAVGDALSVFHDVAREKTGSHSRSSDATGMLTLAKRRFANRMAEIFDDGAPASWDRPASVASQPSIEGIRKSFLGLADQLAGLLAQTVQVADLRKELEVAGAVQQMLLPAQDTFDGGPHRFAAAFVPAAECGGDWWTARALPDGRRVLVVGDVTGHGVAAAMVTGVAKGAFEVSCHLLGERLGAASLLEAMHQAIVDVGKRRYLMSAVAVVIEPDGRRATVANAGHPCPYLVRDGAPQPIVARGTPLGSTDTPSFRPVEVELRPDDLLVLFTDGVTECEAPDGAQFGDRRLRALLAGERRDVAAIRTEVLRALHAFRADKPAVDDITLLVGRIG